MEAVLRQTHTMGVSFFSKRTGRMHSFKHMAYADDLVVVCRDAASAEAFMDSLALNLKKFGLTINTTKTKVMHVVQKPRPSLVLPVAQAVRKAIERDEHVSQYHDAVQCGLNVRQSISTFFGAAKDAGTLVNMIPRRADRVVCPHPRCGVVVFTINKRTGQRYTTALKARLMLHIQERHRVELVEAELVEKVGEQQLRRCEMYEWPPTPLYEADLMKKMTQYERQIKVMHRGVMLEEVAVQKYLGAMIDATDSMEPEVDARVAAGQRAFYKIPRGLWTCGLSTRQKAAVYRSVVMSVIVFGAEAWVLTGEQEKKLEVMMTAQLRTVTGLHAEMIPETWDSTRHDFRVPRVEAVWRAAQIPRLSILVARARLRLAGQWMRMHTENEMVNFTHATHMLGAHGSWWRQVEWDAARVGIRRGIRWNLKEG